MLAGAHVGILSINDRVIDVYLHFVGAGRDVQNPGMIVDRRCLSGWQTIYEYDRTRRGAGHDDLSWIGQLRFPRTEPVARG